MPGQTSNVYAKKTKTCTAAERRLRKPSLFLKKKGSPASIRTENEMVSRACKLNGLLARHPKATRPMDPTSRIGRSRLEWWPHRDRWKATRARRRGFSLPRLRGDRPRFPLSPPPAPATSSRFHPPRARRRRHGRRAVPRDPQPVPPLRWATIQGHGNESTTTHARDPRILLLDPVVGRFSIQGLVLGALVCHSSSSVLLQLVGIRVLVVFLDKKVVLVVLRPVRAPPPNFSAGPLRQCLLLLSTSSC
jgi:hypothetical protein